MAPSLLTLPRELRDMIYRELLLQQHCIIRLLRQDFYRDNAALSKVILRVCKQTYDEGSAIFYAENIFTYRYQQSTVMLSDPFDLCGGFKDLSHGVFARFQHVRLVVSNEKISNDQYVAAFINYLGKLTTSLKTIILIFQVNVAPLCQPWRRAWDPNQEALMRQLPNSKLVKDAISHLHPKVKLQIVLTNQDGVTGFKEVTDLVDHVVAQKQWSVTTQWVAQQLRTMSERAETLKIFRPETVAEAIVLPDTNVFRSVVHHDWTWTLTPASA